MSQFLRIVCFGIVAVLVFDTAASFASVALAFPYENAAVGSAIIYGTVGYFSFRTGGLASCIRAALLVELVDVTIGWPISWLIGPGALPEDQRTVLVISLAVISVFVFAVVCALVGAGVARMLHGRQQGTDA